MANFFVSYDLNGQHPIHQEMDAHLKKLGNCVVRALETVWYVRYTGTRQQLYEYVNSICSQNDSVLVIEASGCYYRNLLGDSQNRINQCWNA